MEAAEAGEGTLEIIVSYAGKRLPNSATSVGNRKFEVTFIGQEQGSHKVEIIYNGIHVKGWLFQSLLRKIFLYVVHFKQSTL